MTLYPAPWVAKDSQSNSLATATKTAASGKTHYITDIVASYGAATGAGLLQIKDGSTVVLEFYVKDTVPCVINLSRPIVGTTGGAVSAELAAGGTSVIGKVAIIGWTD